MGDVSQANPLAILVELEQRIRSISEINELKFVFVNQTQSLVPYRQAILLTIILKSHLVFEYFYNN